MIERREREHMDLWRGRGGERGDGVNGEERKERERWKEEDQWKTEICYGRVIIEKRGEDKQNVKQC